MFIKLVQHHVRIGVFAQVYTDPHAFPAGMVVQIRDPVNFLLADKLCNLLNKTGFVHKIGKLRYNDP